MTLIFDPAGDAWIHQDFWELQRFLGKEFNMQWCNASDEKGHTDRSEGGYDDDEDFLRRTMVFAYQNVGLMTQGIHRPYIARFLELTANRVPVSVIDVGSGGGQIGLALHTLGFKVSFADIYSKSFEWLLFRLRERRLNLPVYMIDLAGEQIPTHDFALCFDVIEHLGMADQEDLICRLAGYGRTVFVNLIRDDRDEMSGVHSHVDFEGLTTFVSLRWPTWARDYYPDKDGNPR